MPTDMRHEEYRWSYMTTEQLYKRLQKIRVAEKLENFITLAYRTSNRYLLQAATVRARDLGHNYLVGRAQDYLREQERQTAAAVNEAVMQQAPKPKPEVQVTDPKPGPETTPEVRKIRIRKKKK